MKIGPALSRLLKIRHDHRSDPASRRRRTLIRAESLDLRLLLSGVSLISASTADSKGVTVRYEVPASGDPGLRFGVDRSASATIDATAEPVGSTLAVPAFDDAGVAATAPGLHQTTIPIPGGLTLNPKHPYVVVVADPETASAGTPGSVVAFRKATIAVVTHGGIQNKAWRKDGPPWEWEMARSLREQGYDRVIAFNWVAASDTPGSASKQAPRLARMIREAAASLPAGEPIDLHMIGHSEGAVVNTLAIVEVERTASPDLRAGFLQDTLLDPHAANPDFPGRQYSTGGPVGWAAKLAIDQYQSKARDPLVFIPHGVNAAQVFYQQTPANQDHGTNAGVYNLWGQVPVKGDAVYFNLTPAGIVHSGKQGVANWYQHQVVPSLGEGAPKLQASTLVEANAPSVVGPSATYAGTAEPGATVRLTVGRGNGPLSLAAMTVVATDGTWTATTRPLTPGTYRVIAASKPSGWTYRRHQAIPTAPLGALVIQP